MRSLAPVVCASLLLAGCEALNPEVVNSWHRFKGVQNGMTREQVHALVGKGSQTGTSEYWIVGAVGPGQRAELTVGYDPEGRVISLERNRHGFGLKRLRICTVEGLSY